MSDISNKRIHLANVVVFCSLLFLGGIASLAMKKDSVSVMENRKLATFPVYSDSAFWSGQYFKNIEQYYADNFPLRDKWISFSNSFRSRFGYESGDIKIYDPANDAEANEKNDTTKNTVNTGPLPDDGAVGEVKKRLFVFKNRGFEMFGGGPGVGKAYANVINSYNRLGLPNLQVYNLVIPVALEFEITEKYKNLQKPNRPAIENIYNNLDSNIKKVWAIDEIRKHREEYIYFNTDHHWTSLGAYYAYRAFCETAGLTPVSLDTVRYKVKPSFLGSLYRLTRDPKLKDNPDSVKYYLFRDSVRFYIGSNNSLTYWGKSKMYAESVSGVNSYSIFLQGDLPIVKMETMHKNGRKIAIVKESYGNAFAPFLINNYEKIIVVDQRYYTGDFVKMLKTEGINELLFINNIFAAHTPFHIEKIKGLKK
ncbi:MAG TPA: DHHW family protein [Chitinophagaceae bacterium]|nr:DHHW family protein [Chitinophagaceae bacterium]HNU15923.1 DHHW family protein [Chitinophagaceae bacterium]